jgi:hypothetical protein
MMILCTLCIAVAVAAAPRAVATPTTLLTEDTFETSSLYTSRSDLVEVPGSNIAISHDEGSIAIESLADSGGSVFYVVQQMGATGGDQLCRLERAGWRRRLLDDLWDTHAAARR